MQTLTAHRRSAAEETYADVERLIHSRVQKFRIKHGGDYGELLSAANEGFLKAYDAFDPARGRFSTILCWKIRGEFSKVLKQRRKNAIQLDHSDTGIREAGKGGDPNGQRIASALIEKAETDPIINLREELSADACEVLRAVFESPADVIRACRNNGGQLHDWRLFVIRFLRRLGWSVGRVRNSFTEIREGLGCRY